MSQSKLCSSLFIEKNVIGIHHVDELPFWCKNETHINELAILLHCSDVDFKGKYDAVGFLCVQIENNKLDLPEM